MDTRNVIALNTLPRLQAKKLLAVICQDRSRIRFTVHAKERMAERLVSATQVVNCLMKGTIIEGPARAANGNWELKIKDIATGDPLNVVAALDTDEFGNYVIIITVIR